jgi:KDO2-lipid IV(A) lauroyltransferase
MLYLLYKIGLFILRVANLNTAYAITSFAIKLKCSFSKNDREIVKKNLRVIIPEAGERELSLLTKDVFVNFGKYLVDFFWLIKNQAGYLKNAVRCIGLENLDDALKVNRGCIIIAGHFGNWELAGCALANLGYRVNVIALAHNDPRINNLFMEQRKKVGVNVIPIGFAKTECQKVLRRNEIVAILGDRPYGDRGIKVNFFDKTAVVPRGAALLSIKNGSPIVLTFIYKEDTGRNIYKLVFEKPVFVKREGLLDKQLNDITQRFINRFEYYIKKYPSQWYMFNKVWEE